MNGYVVYAANSSEGVSMAELSPTAKKILRVLARQPRTELGYAEVQEAVEGSDIQSILQGFQELEREGMLERNTRRDRRLPNPRQMHRITVDGLNYLESQ